MASSATESTPLLGSESHPQAPPKPQRTVTFNPTVQTSSAGSSSSSKKPSAQLPLIPTAQINSSTPVLSTLNSKLRRRHSQGAPILPPLTAAKIGPQRTTKITQKLKLLPDPEQGEDGPDEESGRDVYVQYTRIKDPTARRDAARLGKEDRERLPRVTAYCTAQSYKMEDLMRYLKGKGKMRGALPKLFDECVYTPYNYGMTVEKHTGHMQREAASSSPPPQMVERRYSDSAVEVEGESHQRREELIDLHTDGAGDISMDTGESAMVVPQHGPEDEHFLQSRRDSVDFDTSVHTPEVFLFNYGTVVIWGMTLKEEQRFLKEIAKFETEKLAKDDVQTEDFNFYYTREYQARIYNDFISLRDKRNYMIKLAISHALSQSVKTSLYEDLVDNTIETTKEIPTQIATTGKVNLSRREINMQIGELFILRINIHLQGSVLDAPELMWAEPQLEPIYGAVRSYLEMDQRVSLLTERLDVIADLLAVLKDQLAHTHGEYLEWIVIILIAAEIVVAAVNIVVDLYAGVD
ncbi:DUF155-domain-containing protein [Rhizodiscina lignyota]|uniref:DUF155-domain-containing protein n=1 Tax=Rhizodiscina lignyota TaxID=1504668 RepID=A0A9P4IMT9_9PEZI|nr:DUF155-domain-containing protein [Rhizodiscina lignyota]